MNNFTNKLTNLYLSIMMLGLPLFYTNQYFNITVSKYMFFTMITIVYIGIYTFEVLKEKNWGKHPLDKSVYLFIFLVFLSSLFSKEESWIGMNSRYQGFVSVFLYSMTALIIARHKIDEWKVMNPLVVSFMIVCILATLQNFGFNVLYMFVHVSDKAMKNFTSTIGNIDFYSSYLSLMFPCVYIYYVKSKENFTLLALLIGTLGLLSCGSDSVLLGLFVSLSMMMYMMMDSHADFMRMMKGAIYIVAAAVVYSFVMMAITPLYPRNAILLLMANPLVALLILGMVIGLYFVLDKMHLVNFKKPFIRILIAFILLIIVLMVICTKMHLDLGKLNEYFVFNDAWGHNRGKTWMYCLNEYMHTYSIEEKVFGVGPDCLTSVTSGVFYANMNAAHNEFINYLMCIGLAGLVSYLMVIKKAILTGLQRVKQSTLCMVVFLGILGYLGCSLINIAQPNTTPFLFIFIGILCSRMEEES